MDTFDDSSTVSKLHTSNVSPAPAVHANISHSYLDMPLQLVNQKTDYPRKQLSCALNQNNNNSGDTSESNTEFNINAMITTEGDKLFTTSKDATNNKPTPLASSSMDYGGFLSFGEKQLLSMIDGCTVSNSLVLKAGKNSSFKQHD